MQPIRDLVILKNDDNHAAICSVGGWGSEKLPDAIRLERKADDVLALADDGRVLGRMSLDGGRDVYGADLVFMATLADDGLNSHATVRVIRGK